MKRITRFSLRSRLLFFFLFFASVPILAFSYWTLQTLSTQSENTVLENLQALTKTKAQAIESFAQSRLRNIEKLSELADIVSNVKVLSLAPEPPVTKSNEVKPEALEKEGGGLPLSIEETRIDEADDKKATEAALAADKKKIEAAKAASPKATDAMASLKKTLTVILADQKEYEEIMIIDRQGLVIASTFDGHEGKTAKGIDYFRSGLKSTFFQHVFVSSISEKLTMVISTPIKDETGNVMGVFAARLNLDLFFKLVHDLSGLRQTGETIVAKQIDSEVIFMAPTRHDFNAALTRKVESGSDDLKPLQEAVRGDSGTGRIVDYRGIEGLAAWDHIPSLEWGILVKIDRVEAIQPYMEARYKTMLLTVVMLFGSVLLSLYVSNALLRPISVLQDAADRISRGDLDVRISGFAQDEIGDLADSFGRMIAAIKFLLEEKERNMEP